MPVDDADTQPPELPASSIAQQQKLLARAKVVAKRITERVRKVTAQDTVTDTPALSPADVPTTEELPLA
jgi:hypothetical protein